MLRSGVLTLTSAIAKRVCCAEFALVAVALTFEALRRGWINPKKPSQKDGLPWHYLFAITHLEFSNLAKSAIVTFPCEYILIVSSCPEESITNGLRCRASLVSRALHSTLQNAPYVTLAQTHCRSSAFQACDPDRGEDSCRFVTSTSVVASLLLVSVLSSHGCSTITYSSWTVFYLPAG